MQIFFRGGVKTKFKKSLRKLFSSNKIYDIDNDGNLQLIHKEFSILGFKIKQKIKGSSIDRYILKLIKELNNSERVISSPQIQAIYESNNPKDKLLVKNLYNNLDETAKNNLDKILKRNARVFKYKKDLDKNPKPYEIYTKEELEELDKMLQFEKEIEVCEDYFKWKDYILPVNYFESSVFLYEHGINTLQNKNAINDVIIDAGANIGDSAIVFSKNFPKNKIISFEPTKKNFEICKKTILLNKSDNVLIENMGLGDKEEISYINYNGILGVGSSVSSDKENEKVQITTLDNYVKKHNLKIGLIKTDVEGFEPNLLRGAQETIRTQAPVLLLSIYHNCNDFYQLKPMVEKIMETSEYKYKYNFFQPVYKQCIRECLLICEKI